ncbi:MAG: (Fe-S)-binding protein [Bacteroidales bacterium]|nr:(Fe-S)-binding protein [Bacteroidales bacterium]
MLKKEVNIFIPCCVDQFCPQVGFDMINLLRLMGFEPSYNREQTCCGRVLYDNGNWKEAKSVGEKFINDFSDNKTIVTCSVSCVAYIKNNFLNLFHNTSFHNSSKSLSERIMDISEFIHTNKTDCELGAEFPHKVFLHHNCHSLREYDLRAEVLLILSKVRGLTLVNDNNCEFCCGYGSGFYLYNEPVSQELAGLKVKKALSLGAEYITSTDASCLLQMEQYIKKNNLDIKTIHLVSLLMNSRNEVNE